MVYSLSMENDVQIRTGESKKSNKALWTLLFALLVFLLAIGAIFLSRRSTLQTNGLSPTPTVYDFEDIPTITPVNNGVSTPTSALSPSPTVSTILTITPTKAPTSTPKPTATGPGGFQSNPTNTPTPTNLPLQ